jgi:nucleoside-diphosphate-sugar epimerase
VLVTGAAGRLGRAVSARLYEEGVDFVGTDIVDPGEVPYPFSPADLLDQSGVSRLLEGVDVVMHLGNHAGLGPIPPQIVFGRNTTMNTNVFQGAAEQGVSRIIFASTLQLIGSHVDSRTVGDPPPPPTFPLSGDTPAQPSNLYALSKAVAEQLLRYYADRCGVDCVALRLPLLHHGENLRGVNTGSETTIDILEGFTGLTYRDAAGAFLAVLRSDLTGYRSYMVGTAHRHNDLRLDQLIRTFYPHLPDDLPDLIDSTELSRDTGWEISDDYHRPTTKDTPT